MILTETRNYLSAFFALFIFSGLLVAQDRQELNSEWKCRNINQVSADGQTLSGIDYVLEGWTPAVVPGTVLTTLLANGDVPDPFYGMNNEKIPDIYEVGRDHYTYWFVNDFESEKPTKGAEIWLHFRGINYSCDIYLNGKQVNKEPYKGMFLRKTYNITDLVSKNGKNRLAVLVHPPDHVGNPNGGQGGDGTIGKNVGHQYAAGWDWIQPIRDRNTGIWDKVWIETTGSVNVKNPHVITKVPGKRRNQGPQENAIIDVQVELENPTSQPVKGKVKYTIAGKEQAVDVTVGAKETELISLPSLSLENPKLWWPNGYGEQPLYDLQIQFLLNGKRISDEENLKIGIRQIDDEWNAHTRSMEVKVNGQPIFIKGGNWIISDAMLRFSEDRYDAEVRFHRDMNLNLIRIWGGAITERPEFYAACDKYGLLVIQDFWMSGDCNGRWLDPMKLEDQWTRRNYPDDHNLFIESAADMVKMIRNHASLAMWCGGNEITPPEDILTALTDDILPRLDGTREFITYSNSDSISFNAIGGNGDGPYTIQPMSRFWQERTFPFNSEVGSVGVGDYRSLQHFIPDENMNPPNYPSFVDSVWQYHKYIGYDQYVKPYGESQTAKEFSASAQLVNYNQYRALSEGFTSHMWDWYTGYIIWKTQNPWTSLRGQMYDYYLDPNASLYALKKGNEPLHVMCNPVNGMVTVSNHTFEPQRDLMLKVTAYDMEGNDSLVTQVFVYLEPSSLKNILSVKEVTDKIGAEEGSFLQLQLLNLKQEVVSENFYWFPDATGNYSGLQHYQQAEINIKASYLDEGKIEVTLTNTEDKVSFFNRISLVNSETNKRVLPVFYTDNYLSLPPGGSKVIVIDYKPELVKSPMVSIEGWKTEERMISVK